MKALIIQVALVLAVLLTLQACVRTEGRLYTNAASPKEALKTRVQLARSYIGEKNWEDAKRNLKIAAEIDPNAPEVHEAFALVYQSTGEYELAEASFKKAISLQPNFSRARNNYAAFLYQQARYIEAEAQLQLVVTDTLYESRPRAYVNLGLCRLRLENAAGARDAFNRVLTMDRTNVIALMELAQLEYEQNNWALSKQHYDLYRSLVRRQSSRAMWLGLRLANKLGNADAKASYALALRNLYPDSPEYGAYVRAVKNGEL